MDPTLRAWMNIQVTWEPHAGTDGRGTNTYGAATTFMCFYEGERRMVRDARGELVVSEGTLYTDDSRLSTMTLKDRITLPSGRQPPIIDIKLHYDERGRIDHYEVVL